MWYGIMADDIGSFYSGEFERVEDKVKELYEEDAESLDVVEDIIIGYFDEGDTKKAIALYNELELTEDEEEKVYRKIAEDTEGRMEKSVENASLQSLHHNVGHGMGLISYLGGDPEEYGLKESFEDKRSWVVTKKLMNKKKRMDEGFPGVQNKPEVNKELDEMEKMVELLGEDPSQGILEGLDGELREADVEDFLQ